MGNKLFHWHGTRACCQLRFSESAARFCYSTGGNRASGEGPGPVKKEIQVYGQPEPDDSEQSPQVMLCCFMPVTACWGETLIMFGSLYNANKIWALF